MISSYPKSATVIAIVLAVAVFILFSASPAGVPSMKTAFFGTHGGSIVFQDQVWTQPSDAAGTYNVYATVVQAGTYVVQVHDDTANEYKLDQQFNSSHDCNAGTPYSVTLAANHQYTMHVDVPLDGYAPGIVQTPYAKAVIFFTCSGGSPIR